MRSRFSQTGTCSSANFRSERYLCINDGPAPDLWSPIAGFYQCADGCWIQIHTSFPHHRAGVLKRLGATNEREAVAKAAAWQGHALEDALAVDGVCAGLVRNPDEWAAHAQSVAVSRLPILEIIRIGDSPPEPLPAADRPLSGIRVLDPSRIIAGPVAGRALALHGADVLQVMASHLPAIEMLAIDTGRGKLSAQLDLRAKAEAERLRMLVREADVFLQATGPAPWRGVALVPKRSRRCALASSMSRCLPMAMSALGRISAASIAWSSP